MTVEKALQPST